MATADNVCFDRLAISALTEANRYLHMTDQRGVHDAAVWRQVAKGLRLFPKRPFETLPWLNRSCSFCRRPLLTVERIEDPEDEDDDHEGLAALEFCMRCRYWRWHFLHSSFHNRGGEFTHYYVSYVSKLREFSSELPEGCRIDLAQWLRRRPEAWNSMDPTRLEKFVADVFRANHADSEVVHVGRPADGGVDILFVEGPGRQWLVQVKRRTQWSKGEGIETIRNLLGAMTLYPADCGIVVSTSDHFTYQARLGARRAKDFGLTVKLVDRAILDRMLEPVLPSAPWRDIISARFPAYGDWLATKLPSDQQLEMFPIKFKSVRVRTHERLLYTDDASLVAFWYHDRPRRGVIH